MQKSNKPVLIGFGILLGLLFALILYLFFENRELKEGMENKEPHTETSVEQSSDQTENSESNKETVETKESTDTASDQGSSSAQSLWQATKQINTFDGYLEFIKSKDNDGTYNQESISKLFELGKSGWLYSGRTDGNDTYTDDQMVLVNWRKDNTENLSTALPITGDIVSLISKEARRTYPDFLPRDRQNGIWELQRKAFVIDVRMEGKSAVIIKVVYQ